MTAPALITKRLVNATLWCYGAVWFITEPIAFFSPDLGDVAREYWWLLLIGSTVVGIVRAFRFLEREYQIKGTTVSVGISVGDILKRQDDAVLAVNCTFDTTFEDNVVSGRSLQGRFQRKYCGSIEALDRQIENGLASFSPDMLPPSTKPHGKVKCYRVGTVAKLSVGSRTAYFLATSIHNPHKMASMSLDDLRLSLAGLWAFLQERASYEPLCIPVIGMGFSRLAATRELVIKEIIETFVSACGEGRFTPKLTIVIYPQDLRDKELSLYRMNRFLEDACELAPYVHADKRAPIGTPAR